VLLLGMMALFAFGMVGVQLWRGVMAGTCGYVDPGSGRWLWDPQGTLCALPCSEFAGACVATFGDACPALPVPINNGTSVAVLPTSCRRYQNPDLGFTSFDNILWAMLTAYTVWTTEGWTAIMYNLWHTWGLSPVVSILFVVHLVAGSYFLLELT
jgi:hypothetical protein